MSRRQKSDSLKNTFPFPNDIFLLGLCPGELAVYAYLLRCENRKTHQCWPSYKTIGRAVGLSPNTVRKYVCDLVDRGLIHTENTSVITKTGLKRNGNLLYTILPFGAVLDNHCHRQLAELRLAEAQRKWTQKIKGNAEGPPPQPSEAVAVGKGGAAK